MFTFIFIIFLLAVCAYQRIEIIKFNSKLIELKQILYQVDQRVSTWLPVQFYRRSKIDEKTIEIDEMFNNNLELSKTDLAIIREKVSELRYYNDPIIIWRRESQA